MTDSTWEAMRGQSWDLGDGSEEDFNALLGSLGVFGKPVARQQQALRHWLTTASSGPAPPALLAKVHKFLEVPVE